MHCKLDYSVVYKRKELTDTPTFQTHTLRETRPRKINFSFFTRAQAPAGPYVATPLCVAYLGSCIVPRGLVN